MISRAFDFLARRIDGPLAAALALTIALGLAVVYSASGASIDRTGGDYRSFETVRKRKPLVLEKRFCFGERRFTRPHRQVEHGVRLGPARDVKRVAFKYGVQPLGDLKARSIIPNESALGEHEPVALLGQDVTLFQSLEGHMTRVIAFPLDRRDRADASLFNVVGVQCRKAGGTIRVDQRG